MDFRKKLKKFGMGLLSLSLLFTTVNTGVFAMAGDNGDFISGSVPPSSAESVSDYFKPVSGSNTFFHPDYNNVAVINQNLANQKGAMWTQNKVALSNPFTYKTYLYVGASQGRAMGAVNPVSGGDGITFTMQNDPRGLNAIGDYGHALGAYARTGQGIKNAISFEYDAYPQIFDNDTGDLKFINSDKHTAFVVPSNPNGYAKHFDLKKIGEYDDANGDIQSRWVPFDANWEPEADGSGTLYITLNGVQSSYHIANYTQFFGGDSVYFGYTGGTGTATELQAVAIVQLPPFLYNVTFDTNAPAGEVTPISGQSHEENQLVDSVKDPARASYRFMGWNTKADGTGTTWDFSKDTMPKGDLILFAQWRNNDFDLAFELNGGEGIKPATQVLNPGAFGVSPQNPMRTGYAFTGWNTLADGSGTAWDVEKTPMPEQDVTLFAQWAINQYKLNFDVTGGDTAAPNQQTLDYGSLAQGVVSPTKVGYTFNGWNTSSDGSGISWDFNVTTMPDHDVTLFAQWTINNHKLSFDTQGADSAVPSEQSLDYHEKAVEPNQPTKVGYGFKGWNTLVDGSGKTWDFTTDWMEDSDILLFAQWSLNKYEVTFDSNGGNERGLDIRQVDYDQLVDEPTVPVKTGYTFLSWNTLADGSGTTWNFSSDKMPAANVNLFAQWIINDYELSFDVNGGDTAKPDSQKLIFDSLGQQPENPKRQGYTFLGWNTSKDGKGTLWNFQTNKMPAENVLLYAQWQKDPLPEKKTEDSSKLEGYTVKGQLPQTGGILPILVGVSILGIGFMIGLRTLKKKD